MIDSDKNAFRDVVRATLAVYRVETPPEVLRVWWGVLKQYSLEQVQNGFSRFVSSPESKYPPVPAHIVEAIEAVTSDGRPGADEAWAIYPHDESDTAAITDEIADAMRVAYPMMRGGDKVAARMAFKEAYTRIVATNKAHGIPVRWFMTLGSERDKREIAINDAVVRGLISHDHATGLLPAPNDNSNIVDVLLLANKSAHQTEEERERNKERIAKLKRMLAGNRK